MSMTVAAHSLAVGALLLAAFPAEALSCAPVQPAVTVALAIPPPRIDNTLPLAALQRIASREHAGRALGLYQSVLQLHWAIGFSRRSDGDRVCLAIASVAVTLSMPARVIYIIRERPPGTCAYESVLAHERRHQATDDAIIAEYRPRLAAAVADAIRAAPPELVARGGIPVAEKRGSTLVSGALLRGFDALARERAARQRAVDSTDEYRRVRAACG